MALQAGDLFVVNRAGTSYKLDYTALQTALAYTLPVATTSTVGGVKQGTNISIAGDGTISANITGALVYKGTLANTANAPAGAVQGNTYVLSSTGNLSGTGWGALAGTAVSAGDMLLFTGTSWDHVGSSGGGATGVTSISASPNTGVTVTGGTSSTPVIAGIDASSTAKGVVQLADAAAITTGTSTTLAVTVAQLDAAKAVYASSAETLAGTITNKSVTPKAAKDTYLPLNFSTLTALP